MPLTRNLFVALSAFAGLAAGSPVSSGWGDWAQTSTASSPAGTPSPSASSGPTSPPYLHELALAAGKKYFGTATDQPVRVFISTYQIRADMYRVLERTTIPRIKQFSMIPASSARSHLPTS
jgi:hypothetical protein